MDYNNARMWTFNNIISIEDENSILVHSNKTNTNQGWSTKECMVVLVQMQASIIKH
jgi:hypothetical protein